MKNKTIKIKGYIEKDDIYDMKQSLQGVPIYKTVKGCIRSLSGYENLKVIPVSIVIKFGRGKNNV